MKLTDPFQAARQPLAAEEHLLRPAQGFSMEPRHAWLRRTLLSLGLGAATTALIAWPLAAAAVHWGWVEHRLVSHGGRAFVGDGPERFKASSSHRWLSDWYSVVRTRRVDSVLPLGEPQRLPHWVATPDQAIARGMPGQVGSVDTGATGWPWRCITSESWQVWTTIRTGEPVDADLVARPPASGLALREHLRSALVVGTTECGRTIIGLRPVWSGLIADTAVWSCAWLAALWLAGAATAATRRRCGRCVSCGYDRDGLVAADRCPECGRAA
ncbi:MAG TPA: hypothetical protein VEB22_14115 [Phycisphaerales bacterium]|nr:hypothetical protein [Phycisphaerales bacterium]